MLHTTSNGLSQGLWKLLDNLTYLNFFRNGLISVEEEENTNVSNICAVGDICEGKIRADSSSNTGWRTTGQQALLTELAHW